MSVRAYLLVAFVVAYVAMATAHGGWGHRGGWGRPRRYYSNRGGALMRKACRVTNSTGGLIKFRQCWFGSQCSVGPLAVDWEGDSFNLFFCDNKGDFLYEAACQTRSPDAELDTDRECRGENNTCSVGPIRIEFDDSPVNATFCSQPEGGCGRRWYRRTPSPAPDPTPAAPSATPTPPQVTTTIQEPIDSDQADVE